MLAALVDLVVASICLLAQTGLFARRLARRRVTWWRWLLLALTGLWAILCCVLAVQAWDMYRAVSAGLWGSGKGLCFSAAWMGKETQIALIGAAVPLVLGWVARLAFLQRPRAA
jgi:hypothetical protein